jgi:hypothetical protein
MGPSHLGNPFASGNPQAQRKPFWIVAVQVTLDKSFLSVPSIKCGNWFYWADRAEREESPLFMRILGYAARKSITCRIWGGSNPLSAPTDLFSCILRAVELSTGDLRHAIRNRFVLA